MWLFNNTFSGIYMTKHDNQGTHVGSPLRRHGEGKKKIRWE